MHSRTFTYEITVNGAAYDILDYASPEKLDSSEILDIWKSLMDESNLAIPVGILKARCLTV